MSDLRTRFKVYEPATDNLRFPTEADMARIEAVLPGFAENFNPETDLRDSNLIIGMEMRCGLLLGPVKPAERSP